MRFLPFDVLNKTLQAEYKELARTSDTTHLICRDFSPETVVKVFDHLNDVEVEHAHTAMVGPDYEEYALIEIPTE